MLDRQKATKIAKEWISAWNEHDIDKIMVHYEDNVEFISPIIVQLLGEKFGKIEGKENVKNYFLKGLETYPDLMFTLIEVLVGINSIVLYYINYKGTKTAKYMEISYSGKIKKVVANYSIE